MGKAEFNDIGPSVLSFRGTDDLPLRERGRGYTLIEVMIAVTLTLVLMYALAAIFGRVTSIMTQTQDILSMTNNLRAAKDRLREDLENLTVPRLKAPTSRYGFFSYVEGQGNAPRNFVYQPAPSGFFYATNSRTFSTYGNFDGRQPTVDNTVGDTDDILSFTVRAPAGKWFRGRCFKKLSDDVTSYDYQASIDDNIETIESEYAEVVWFLRGTTLYRRVLLIIPDEVLEERLRSLNLYVQYNFPEIAGSPLFMPSAGFGFYRFFDVSVHFDSDKTLSWMNVRDSTHYSLPGRVVANTVSDLANRKNRYGYWSTPVVDSLSEEPLDDPGISGHEGGWYWMRMPTLQESALWSPFSKSDGKFFRAGFPFGRNPKALLEPPTWMGDRLALQDRYSAYDTKQLPEVPFIDDWQFPNPWAQQEPFSGQLDLSSILPTDLGQLSEQQERELKLAGLANPGDYKKLNNDVLLTNVLSFDVKVWNDVDVSKGESGSFVDLGAGEVMSANSNGEQIRLDGVPLFDVSGNGITLDPNGRPISPPDPNPMNFLTGGNYSHNVVGNLPLLFDPTTHDPIVSAPCYRPVMPAVFDTWTEEYQKEFLTQSWSGVFGASSRPGFTVGDIPLDGNVTASDLPDYPPPYEAEIKVIQVGLRTFDPVSRTIKNATVEIKIP